MNRIKARLAAQETQLGLWLALSSPAVTEMAAAAGYDWLLIDGEHGPNLVPQMIEQLRIIEGSGTDALVRVPVNEEWVIKMALDIGATTLMVPMIHTPEDARRAVAAMKYPPEGIRGMGASLARASGYGRNADYVRTANATTCLIAQIESRQALENLEAIATTPGVDAIFIGPADLSADMGYPGNPGADEVQTAIAEAYATCKRLGVASGTVTFALEDVPGLSAMGASFIGVGGDTTLMQRAMQGHVAAARGALANGND